MLLCMLLVTCFVICKIHMYIICVYANAYVGLCLVYKDVLNVHIYILCSHLRGRYVDALCVYVCVCGEKQCDLSVAIYRLIRWHQRAFWLVESASAAGSQQDGYCVKDWQNSCTVVIILIYTGYIMWLWIYCVPVLRINCRWRVATKILIFRVHIVQEFSEHLLLHLWLLCWLKSKMASSCVDVYCCSAVCVVRRSCK